MGKRSAARAAALAYAQQPAELGLLDGDLGVSSDVEGADDAAVRLASAAAAAGPRANGGAAAGSGEDASGGEAGEDEDSEGEASGDDSDAGVSSADEAAGRSEDAELDRALVDLVRAGRAARLRGRRGSRRRRAGARPAAAGRRRGQRLVRGRAPQPEHRQGL